MLKEEEKNLQPNESALDSQPGSTADDYIQAISELKANSVDRKKYEEALAENKKLLNAIVNGQDIDLPSKAEPVDQDALRKELYSRDSDLNNLEYVKKTLQLREAIIAEGKPDPFLPHGSKITPTNEDYEAAQRVAQVLQECVDYADGDSAVFTNELQRRTIDTGPHFKRR